MKYINIKPKKTTKSAIREHNITEKAIAVARDRGFTTDDLLKYDIVPSPYLFDNNGMMTKPEKSQLIKEIESHLVDGENDYQKKMNSGFIIDVMNVVRRISSAEFSNFGDLLLKLSKTTEGGTLYLTYIPMGHQ